MRGKRSKQYRKLMHQYGVHFGFREPYQVLLDAQVLEDASRYKMDFIAMLEKTLHGQIKPMITQCSMRHLYNAKPKDDILIDHAKGFERRRCNHHELDEPLSTLECFQSVIDPKSTRTNKHRYVVVSQDDDVRAYLRSIPGVPMIYLKRSVMIMEPMAGITERAMQRGEKDKFRSGLVGDGRAVRGVKRDRGDASDDDEPDGDDGTPQALAHAKPVPKKRKRGPSGPNPLSVKKKARPEVVMTKPKTQTQAQQNDGNDPEQRKRKRKHKSSREITANAPSTMLET